MKTRNLFLLLTVISIMTVPASAQTSDRWGMFSRAATIAENRDSNKWVFRLVSDCTYDQGRCLERTFDYGGVYLRSSGTELIFTGIFELSADYRVVRGENARFHLNIDTDGDGTANGNISILLGPAGDGWQRSGNLINNPVVSYDLSQFGGSPKGSYPEAVALIGRARVLGIALVADKGWREPQEVLVDNVKVNDQTMLARYFTRSQGRRIVE